mmetsp:Transcript_110125/g.355452  ORF Transcript_110125/g.355452 Transcript_110125/m.355452 type:complete len:278 (-) Transcript_110125:114-947(-)
MEGLEGVDAAAVEDVRAREQLHARAATATKLAVLEADRAVHRVSAVQGGAARPSPDVSVRNASAGRNWRSDSGWARGRAGAGSSAMAMEVLESLQAFSQLRRRPCDTLIQLLQEAVQRVLADLAYPLELAARNAKRAATEPPVQRWCLGLDVRLPEVLEDLRPASVAAPSALDAARALAPPDHEAAKMRRHIARGATAERATALAGKLLEAAHAFAVEHVAATEDDLWPFAEVIEADAAARVAVLAGVGCPFHSLPLAGRKRLRGFGHQAQLLGKRQ